MAAKIVLKHKEHDDLVFERLEEDMLLLDGSGFGVTILLREVWRTGSNIWSIDVYRYNTPSGLMGMAASVTISQSRPSASFYPSDGLQLIADFIE